MVAMLFPFAVGPAPELLDQLVGDDPREPRFIRTVSRHGYQFVCADLVEDTDDGVQAVAGVSLAAAPRVAPAQPARPKIGTLAL